MPSDFRSHLRDWHTKISNDQVILALSDLRMDYALRYAWRGWRHDFAWPWQFALAVVKGSLQVLRRLLIRSNYS